MHFSAEYKREKRQLEIKNKILERSGYDEVFYGDDGGEASDYNQIKDAVHSKIEILMKKILLKLLEGILLAGMVIFLGIMFSNFYNRTPSYKKPC